MTHTNAVRRTMEGTMHHPAPPAAVFPLLCPVRERDWLEGWEAEIVYSQSGVAEPGCVFTTPGPDGTRHVWTVSRHDPQEAMVGFVVVAPGFHVMTLEIELRPEGEGTLAVWRRSFTALTPEGARSFAAATDRHHAHRIAQLESAINHYLQTGAMLRA